MTTNINFTSMEQQVLEAINANTDWNGGEPGWGPTLLTLERGTDISTKRLSGVISSLSQKGAIDVEDGCGVIPTLYNLSHHYSHRV